jgi:Amt family ammonium transporter
VWAVEKLKPIIGLDDAFDVFGVHGVGGIVGGLLTPVFALTALGGQGFSEGRGLFDQLLINGGALLFSIIFSAVTSYIAFKVASALCGGLRVEEDSEVDGLDLSAHGEVGYRFSN